MCIAHYNALLQRWIASGAALVLRSNTHGSTCLSVFFFVFFQADDGIRYLVRSRGLGDVYKRQMLDSACIGCAASCAIESISTSLAVALRGELKSAGGATSVVRFRSRVARCLLYTSDPAAGRSSGDLGGPRIIKKKKLRERTTYGEIILQE